MNLAVYDRKADRLHSREVFPNMNRDQLIASLLASQEAAQAFGGSINAIFVAWQDAPSDYIAVFPLGRTADRELPKTVLDRIERLARGWPSQAVNSGGR
jgi:hypothetical protein